MASGEPLTAEHIVTLEPHPGGELVLNTRSGRCLAYLDDKRADWFVVPRSDRETMIRSALAAWQGTWLLDT